MARNSKLKKSTIILQKPSGTIAVHVDINTRQRKLYNGLLYVAKRQIHTELREEMDALVKRLFIDKNENKGIAIAVLEGIVDNLSKKINKGNCREQLVYFLTDLKNKIIDMINILNGSSNDKETIYQKKLKDILPRIAEFSLLNKKREPFRVPLSELKKSLTEEERKDRNGSIYVKQLRELMSKTAEYNILTKDKIIHDEFVLIPRITRVLDGKSKLVYIEYEIPTMVNESLIRSDGIYANIDLVIIRGLKSKYAIILYELCKDYQKKEIPKMEISTFRKIFCVENKYLYMNGLKQRVLDPAITEINNNPNINFKVKYKPIKTGREHTHIKFMVTDKEKKIGTKKSTKEIAGATTENESLEKLLAMIPKKEREKNRTLIEQILTGKIKVEKPATVKLIDYIAWQIAYINNYKGSIGHYNALLKTALKDGYSSEPNKKKPSKKEIKSCTTSSDEKYNGGIQLSKEQYLKFLEQDEKVIENYIQKAQQANSEMEKSGKKFAVELALKHIAATLWNEDIVQEAKKKREECS